MNRRLGVLISGRGSNLQALVDATRDGRLEAAVVAVISNRPAAAGLERARQAGIEALVIDSRAWTSRDEYDRAIARELTARDVGLVCLGGYMRLVGPALLDAFPNAVLNVHPSLLPAFPGLDAQRQAVEHGVKVSGVTVHFVTLELDGGPIVLQRAVPVLDHDTRDTLADRILAEEHRAYPDAVKLVLDGGWRIDGRTFVRSASAAST
ncbi:MAG: phosphoribosylglycinamide formyltransferase [Vicinamibacterales bacterium]